MEVSRKKLEVLEAWINTYDNNTALSDIFCVLKDEIEYWQSKYIDCFKEYQEVVEQKDKEIFIYKNAINEGSDTKTGLLKNKSVDRIGKVGTNTYGSLMVVDEYTSPSDIWVKFIEHGNRVHTQWGSFKRGVVKNVYDRIIYDVGYIGEGEYKTKTNGKMTNQYGTWYNVMTRCNNKEYQEKQPSYVGCYVCEEWLNFQNFAKWYDENYYEIDGEKMNLDKDILVKGNKVYSPDTCAFVPASINMIFVKNNAIRGNLPIGVTFNKSHKLYQANCSNGKKNNKHLGFFNTAEEAFQEYKKVKEKVIKETANLYKGKIPIEIYEAMLSYTVDITD